MTCLEPISQPVRAHRVRIELDQSAGAYIYVWMSAESTFPEKDHLQDTLDIAKKQCAEDYGIPITAWREVEAG